MSAVRPDAGSHKPTEQTRPPFACVALLLQGGGALGAYQGGVYQALTEAGLHPDWVAGISIGAINAAIIAGNPVQSRVARLREFWEAITAQPWYADASIAPLVGRAAAGRQFINQISAAQAVVAGVPGFFRPRVPNPWLRPTGSPGATSIYDTSDLRGTLEHLIDFDRINARACRLSVGAVNVRTGNFAYFDTTTHRIRVEHVMASGALPPGFPPVEVDGDPYWDGGLVSNTPLQWVLEHGPRQDTLAFQVDLWNARGRPPANMADVLVREKEIQYSSRTRANTDNFARMQKLRNAVATAIASLPPEARNLPQLAPLTGIADHSVYNIVHLIYRSKHYEGNAKDYEFSRLSMEEHWSSGYEDAVRSLRDPAVLRRPAGGEGVFTFDVARPGDERAKDAQC
jgi:NTE family protein